MDKNDAPPLGLPRYADQFTNRARATERGADPPTSDYRRKQQGQHQFNTQQVMTATDTDTPTPVPVVEAVQVNEMSSVVAPSFLSSTISKWILAIAVSLILSTGIFLGGFCGAGGCTTSDENNQVNNKGFTGIPAPPAGTDEDADQVSPTSPPSTQLVFPTLDPSTIAAPTHQPIRQLSNPTMAPTRSPTNVIPTGSPIMGERTPRPTVLPTLAVDVPVRIPTLKPTQQPMFRPTESPTAQPTADSLITQLPTPGPTLRPTGNLSKQSTKQPTNRPTNTPIRYPTASPTALPVILPAPLSTPSPTLSPSKAPTRRPTRPPTREPTTRPTEFPMRGPTTRPTVETTTGPTQSPTREPTKESTVEPSPRLTPRPTLEPTPLPTLVPTRKPTQRPTSATRPSPSPTASLGAAPLASCFSNNDCVEGACGYAQGLYSFESYRVCCPGGENFQGSYRGITNTYCKGMPDGTICADFDQLCASGFCISNACVQESHKLADLSLCSEDADCRSNDCALEEGGYDFQTDKVCCPDASFTGYYSGIEDVYCGGMPNGIFCSEKNQMCASGLCIGGYCTSGTLADFLACTEGADCTNSVCALREGVYDFQTSKVCCPDGNSFTGSYKGIEDTYCQGMVAGTLCSNFNLLCASGMCINGVCTDVKLDDLGVCRENADCQNGECALSEKLYDFQTDKVCCPNGLSFLGSHNGISYTFCQDLPSGTLCGGYSQMCASGNCVSGSCI